MITLDMLYSWEMMRKRRIAAAGGGSTPLTLTALTAGSKVTLNKVGSPPSVELEYSTGGAWSTYTIGTEITLASAGDYIKFRGDNNTFSTTLSDYYKFVMSGTIAASGNVMSLVIARVITDNTGQLLLSIPVLQLHIPHYRACIASHDAGDTVLLPNVLKPTSLTTAPALPATNACVVAIARSLAHIPHYRPCIAGRNVGGSVHYKCSTTAHPSLPRLHCQPRRRQSAIEQCSLAAHRLATTTLRHVLLPNVLLHILTTAPALPATTLASYCYQTMFYGCSKLVSIEVSFASWTQATSQTDSWVNGVASSGTFTKPTALAPEYGISRIPTGWTVVNKE